MRGLKIKIVKGKVFVKSKVLEKHPALNLPIGAPKVQGGYIIQNRIGFNEWINKHF